MGERTYWIIGAGALALAWFLHRSNRPKAAPTGPPLARLSVSADSWYPNIGSGGTAYPLVLPPAANGGLGPGVYTRPTSSSGSFYVPGIFTTTRPNPFLPYQPGTNPAPLYNEPAPIPNNPDLSAF